MLKDHGVFATGPFLTLPEESGSGAFIKRSIELERAVAEDAKVAPSDPAPPASKPVSSAICPVLSVDPTPLRMRHLGLTTPKSDTLRPAGTLALHSDRLSAGSSGDSEFESACLLLEGFLGSITSDFSIRTRGTGN